MILIYLGNINTFLHIIYINYQINTHQNYELRI